MPFDVSTYLNKSCLPWGCHLAALSCCCRGCVVFLSSWTRIVWSSLRQKMERCHALDSNRSTTGTLIGLPLSLQLLGDPTEMLKGTLSGCEDRTVGDKKAGSLRDNWQLLPTGGAVPCAEHRWSDSRTTTTWCAGPAACRSAAAVMLSCCATKGCATFPAAKLQPTQAVASSIPGTRLGLITLAKLPYQTLDPSEAKALSSCPSCVVV